MTQPVGNRTRHGGYERSQDIEGRENPTGQEEIQAKVCPELWKDGWGLSDLKSGHHSDSDKKKQATPLSPCFNSQITPIAFHSQQAPKAFHLRQSNPRIDTY